MPIAPMHLPTRPKGTQTTPIAAQRSALLLTAAALLASASAAQQPSVEAGKPQALPTVAIKAGLHIVTAQVAQSPQQRQVGLMFRKTMPQNEGMLFVFEQASVQCFWMKNTLLPLAIAFVAEDGSIVNIEEMKAGSTDSHCSAIPVRYALEMNKGWFAKKGVKPGDKLKGKAFGN